MSSKLDNSWPQWLQCPGVWSLHGDGEGEQLRRGRVWRGRGFGSDCAPSAPRSPGHGGHERGGGGEQRTRTEKAEKMEQEAVQQGE